MMYNSYVIKKLLLNPTESVGFLLVHPSLRTRTHTSWLPSSCFIVHWTSHDILAYCRFCKYGDHHIMPWHCQWQLYSYCSKSTNTQLLRTRTSTVILKEYNVSLCPRYFFDSCWYNSHVYLLPFFLNFRMKDQEAAQLWAVALIELLDSCNKY